MRTYPTGGREARGEGLKILPWLAGALLLGWPMASRAQEVKPSLWGTDGAVMAIAHSGDAIYIGGAFSTVGPCTGGGVPLDRWTGTPRQDYPKVAGSVYAIAPDGLGGWYIGGQFSGVGELPRTNLAHVLADGSVARWAPVANDAVTGLLVRQHTVYAWGLFTSIDGQRRWYIAALDGSTGRVTRWDARASSFVFAVALRGNTLYAGGNFDMIGGQRRVRIAALDAATAAATAWDPVADYTVTAIAVSGNTVYAGGVFTFIGGQSREHLAALNATTGTALDWNPGASHPSGEYDNPLDVSALRVAGRTVYVAGGFQTIGGRSRGGLAALDAESGAVEEWDPAPADSLVPHPVVLTLLVEGCEVYVGGMFTRIGGQPRNGLAAIDARTGAATIWNPNPNGSVSALAVSGTTIYAGGGFTSIGKEWQPRHSLAALDVRSGRLLDWNPSGDIFDIRSLAVVGSTVYVGGDFGSVGGQPRRNIAALDARAGAATEWNPGADGEVWTLFADTGTVYVGGAFSSIGGQPRSHVAALDARTAIATAWNPSANDLVTTLKVSGSTVYAGGLFSRIGGRLLNYLAALDSATGTAQAWNPRANGPVSALGVSDSIVYAGGDFDSIGGEPRTFLGALSAVTGAATKWAPNPGGSIEALALSDSTVYAGGFFQSVGGISRNFIVALEAASGEPAAWGPCSDGVVWALDVRENTVYVGGAFGRMGPVPQVNVAALTGSTRAGYSLGPWRPGIQSVALEQNMPNPTRSSTTVRFALSSSSAVTLVIYDVQGRRVETLLDHEPRVAGVHEVPVHVGGWNPGVYYYRLEAGGASATRKMLVLR